MSRGNLFLLAVFGNILAFEEIQGLRLIFKFSKIFVNFESPTNDFSNKNEHIIVLKSGKVMNAIATVYNQEIIHNTQVYENVRNKRIELIDEIIVNLMKLFSYPSKFFWIKRNNINGYDCYKKIVEDNDYDDYFDQEYKLSGIKTNNTIFFINLRWVSFEMVEHQIKICRFPYIDNASFQPSKTKLVFGCLQ